MINIAYFISSHGFGHAARSSAVISSLLKMRTNIHFELFTSTQKWFFDESISPNFNYHFIKSDVGLIQTTPLYHDLPETIKELNRFLSFPENQISDLASQLKEHNIDLVICDISPLGILAAQQAGLPSLLIENFTWDWIYEEYQSEYPAFYEIIQSLKRIYQQSTFHIQTQPLCSPSPESSWGAAPASRLPRQSPEHIRSRLGIPSNANMILVTMGGIQEDFSQMGEVRLDESTYVVIPGGSDTIERHGNTIFLPHHSDFYHPDLVHAANAIIGKAGYSTIAETYLADVPFGYILRSNFRESALLGEYIQQELNGFEIDEHAFKGQNWAACIPSLLKLKTPKRDRPNGADQIASFILTDILKTDRQPPNP